MNQVKRSADANDSGAPVDDILQNDLTDQSSDMPLVAPGDYRLKVIKVEQKRNGEDTGNYLKITLATADEAKTVTGEPLRPGWLLFTNISITPTANYPKSSIDRSLKLFKEACGNPNGPFAPLSQYEGCVVQAKVKVKQGKGDFDGEQNNVSFVKPKNN